MYSKEKNILRIIKKNLLLNKFDAKKIVFFLHLPSWSVFRVWWGFGTLIIFFRYPREREREREKEKERESERKGEKGKKEKDQRQSERK